nr:MAG TPA: hypothetical protein [Bacteriophage sp.]
MNFLRITQINRKKKLNYLLNRVVFKRYLIYLMKILRMKKKNLC